MSTPPKPDGYPDTPTLDERTRVKPFSQKIGEFLEWLQSERGVTFALYHHHDDACFTQNHDTVEQFRAWVDSEIKEDRMVRSKDAQRFDKRKIVDDREYEGGRFDDPYCGCYDGQLMSDSISISNLLHEFFNIDPQKEEEEMRAVLDWQRKQNEKAP